MKLGEVLLFIIGVFTFVMVVVSFVYMTRNLAPVTREVVKTVEVTAMPEPTATVSAAVKRVLPVVSVSPAVVK